MQTLTLEELLLVCGGKTDPQREAWETGQSDGPTNGGSRDPDDHDV